MAVPAMIGGGTSGEAEGEPGGLVAVPVMQAEGWQGLAEASSKEGSPVEPLRRMGKAIKAGPRDSSYGGGRRGSEIPLGRAVGGGGEKAGVQGPERQKVLGATRAEMGKEPVDDGLGQGVHSPVKGSSSKTKAKGPGGRRGPEQMLQSQGGILEGGEGRVVEETDGGGKMKGGLGGSPGGRGRAILGSGAGVSASLSPGVGEDSGVAAGAVGSQKMGKGAEGNPRVGRPGAKGKSGGAGKEERKGMGAGRGQATSPGGPSVVDSPVRRERTRSPVVGRMAGGVGEASSPGLRGAQVRQPLFSHGTLVSRIQKAVSQIAYDDYEGKVA